MAETIVLVPGIGLGGAELLPLAWRLRRSGYHATIFWTNPWRGNLAAKASALRRLLIARQIERPSFVTHSFGGRIVLQLLNDYPEQSVGRVVALAFAAHRLLRGPAHAARTRWALGCRRGAGRRGRAAVPAHSRGR